MNRSDNIITRLIDKVNSNTNEIIGIKRALSIKNVESKSSDITGQQGGSTSIINHSGLLGLDASDSHPISAITNLQTTLNGKVTANNAITAATKCKITYDAKGLVTSGADLVENDIPTLSTNKITGLTDFMSLFNSMFIKKPKEGGGYYIEAQLDFVSILGVTAYGNGSGGGGGSGSAVWGGIVGTLSNQTDLMVALAEKSNVGHTHAYDTISGRPSLALVATSGSYNDLTDRPTIPSLAGYATQSWVQSQNYLTSITKAMVEGVLTGNISSHTHSYLPLSGGIMSGAIQMGGNRIKYNTYTIHNELLDDTSHGLTTFSISTPDESAVSYLGILSVNDIYKFQIGSSGGGRNILKYRGYNGNAATWDDWVSIYHSGNCNKNTVPWTCSRLTIGSIVLDVVDGNLRINGNVFATGGVSAYGQNSGGGGGGASNLYQLGDVPDYRTSYRGKILKSKSDGSGVEWVDMPNSAVWGNIGGTLSAQTDLVNALAGKAALSHTHTKSQITDFAHTHSISDVTGLQTALDGKQATISDLTTIRSNAANGNTAYGWGNHALQGYLTAITKTMVENVLTGNISSHTHSYLPLSGGTMTGDITMSSGNGIKYPAPSADAWTNPRYSGIRVLCTANHAAEGAVDNYAVCLSVGNYYGFQLASYGGDDGRYWIRGIINNSQSNWHQLYHSGNLTNLSQLTDNLGSNPAHTHSQYLTSALAATTYHPKGGSTALPFSASSLNLSGAITGATNINSVLYFDTLKSDFQCTTSSIPSQGSLASVPHVSIGIKGLYGMYFYTTGNGAGHIQQGRADGTATHYNLCLQELGGNVGIGTTSPSYELDVNGTLNATTIYQGGTALANTYHPKFGSTALPFDAKSLSLAGEISGATDITASGNVRIGTNTSSAYKLDVNGIMHTSGNVVSDQTGIFGKMTIMGTGGIYRKDNEGNDRAIFGGDIDNDGGYIMGGVGGAMLKPVHYYGNPIRFMVNNNITGSWNSTGLYIGDAGQYNGAAQKLDVCGKIRLRNTSDTSKYIDLEIDANGNLKINGNVFATGAVTAYQTN